MDTKTICDKIRLQTGLKIVEFAKQHKVSTRFVYSSIKGGGSRAMRITIAGLVGTLPSQIWIDLPESKRILDDMYYNRKASKNG